MAHYAETTSGTATNYDSWVVPAPMGDVVSSKFEVALSGKYIFKVAATEGGGNEVGFYSEADVHFVADTTPPRPVVEKLPGKTEACISLPCSGRLEGLHRVKYISLIVENIATEVSTEYSINLYETGDTDEFIVIKDRLIVPN
eukprot:16698_1